MGTARKILALFQEDRLKLKAFGKAAGSASRIHEALQRNPVASIPKLSKISGLSQPAIARALLNLKAIGVRESTGKARYRRFIYQPYLDILAR